MQNLYAFGRERFLTIDNPLNPPGVGVGPIFFKGETIYPHMRAKFGRGAVRRRGPTARSDGQVYNRTKVRTDWSESTHGRTV